MIGGCVIDIGVDSTYFAPGDPDALLRSYLLMVRRTRDQRRAVSITLRREDIEVIAEHLDQTAERVLDRLADLMGSTRAQRAAMLALLATGAMLIAVAGSAAADAPRSALDPSPGVTRPVVLDVGGVHQAVWAGSAALTSETSETSETTETTETMETMDAVDHVEQSALRGFDAVSIDAVEISASTLADAVATAIEGRTTRSEHATTSSAPRSDASEQMLVAVGSPPVPALVTDESSSETVETGVTDDGSTVAVREPPAPPPPTIGGESSGDSTTGVTDDGSLAAVGQPPVPTPPIPSGGSSTEPIETGVTDDGSTIAVEQPPAPPPAASSEG